jgi:hypothetical protein
VIVHLFDISGIVDHHCLEVIVHLFDISEIVDHHCLEVIVHLFDISGIVDHHCLEVIVHLFDIIGMVDHHCLEQSPIQSCWSLQALYLCKRLKSSPKTRDHVTNDHVTIFDVDIQKLAFDSPSRRCSCHRLIFNNCI